MEEDHEKEKKPRLGCEEWRTKEGNMRVSIPCFMRRIWTPVLQHTHVTLLNVAQAQSLLGLLTFAHLKYRFW